MNQPINDRRSNAETEKKTVGGTHGAESKAGGGIQDILKKLQSDDIILLVVILLLLLDDCEDKLLLAVLAFVFLSD